MVYPSWYINKTKANKVRINKHSSYDTTHEASLDCRCQVHQEFTRNLPET